MTNEENQALIAECDARIKAVRELVKIGLPLLKEASEDLAIAEIALAALTAPPVISDDTKRMDWLCAHCVEVRYPLMYGSRAMFHAQQDSEEWDLPHHTTLREQVDAAIANEVQE